jgi:hypothetical protein
MAYCQYPPAANPLLAPQQLTPLLLLLHTLAADARAKGVKLLPGKPSLGLVLTRLADGGLPLRGPTGLGLRVQESARWVPAALAADSASHYQITLLLLPAGHHGDVEHP